MLTPTDFFDLDGFEHKSLFYDSQVTYVWDVLRLLGSYLAHIIRPEIHGQVMQGAYLLDDKIFIGPGSVVEPGAVVKGPTYIGANTQVRHGAYVRGNVLIGANCVVGHTTEIKNSIMLNDAHAAHFAYVGDSVLGNHVNLGAGSRLANLKLDRSNVTVKIEGKTYDTGLRKLGAILGDHVETGCNAVLNPGTLLGPGCMAYALTLLRGYYPANSIIKRASDAPTVLLVNT
ncbi:MAG: glucose-1-phosphate thymidylyltransferase [Anaerolineae bacterium]